jgi:hypothetical protein
VGLSGQDASGSGNGPVARLCKNSKKLSDSIKGREFLDQLNDC